MNKKIAYVILLSLILTPILEACTFTILNNSPYEEIFVTDKEHLAEIVNRKTLMEVHYLAAKKKEKSPESPIEEAVRISKSMKKNAAKGQITGKWFDVYIPFYANKKTSRTDPPAQFKKAYRVSINYCHEDNYITYQNIVKAADPKTADSITQTEHKRAQEGKRPRFVVVDFSNPEQAANADSLVGSHDSETLQNNNKMLPEAKPAPEKKSKRRKQNLQKATEFIGASKPQRPQDEEFNEFLAYPGGDPQDFQGYIP